MEKGNGAQRSGREEDMSDAFKDFAATPTLTLEPDLGRNVCGSGTGGEDGGTGAE